jgi:hypothetical protein
LIRPERTLAHEPVDFGPQRVDVDREAGHAGYGVDATVGRRDRVNVAAVLAELEDLEASELGVDEPVEADAESLVLGELLDAVSALVRSAGAHEVRRCVDHDRISPRKA